MSFPLVGHTGCKFHKDKKNMGQANGSFKHGRYSKYLPKGIDERINALTESRREGDYLSLKDQIDLTEVRISQLVEQLDSAASEQTWRDIRQARLDIQAGIKAGDVDKIGQALRVLESISTKGMKEYRAWDELFRVQRHFNNLVSSERKKLIEDKFMLSLDDVSLILAMIGHAINEEVKDALTRQRLANSIKLISAKAGFEIT